MRTHNPWDHVSLADRVVRMQAMERVALRVKLDDHPEFKELEMELKKPEVGRDKVKVNRLADALNAKGFSDRDIEKGL